MELLVYPVIVFCFGMPQVQFLPYVYRELKTAFVMWCEDPFLGGGGGGVVPKIIGYYFNNYYDTLFPFLFFFFEL